MLNNWEKFWKVRKSREVDLKPFWNNFVVLRERLIKQFSDFRELKSLEVGCGRAIMSDYLYIYGWDTHAIDKYYIPPNNGRRHKFYQADVFDMPFPDNYFDLVFSYGLLEHFMIDQGLILNRCWKKMKPGGLSIHYVVPKKMANIFEDRSVYRDPCYYLRDGKIIWVYPCIPTKRWKTNKWLGKGFWYEDFGPGNS